MKRIGTLARMATALLLCFSMCMNVFAIEETTGTVEVNTYTGLTESIDVTITIEQTTDENGAVTQTTTSEAEDFVADSGLTVDYTGTSQLTTAEDGITTGTEEEEYTSTNGFYNAEGGSTTTTERETVEATVELPLTDQDDPDTAEDETSCTVTGEEAGTAETTGDVPTSDQDGVYDYTTETVQTQGSITVTTEEVTFTETLGGESSDMEYVLSDTEPDSDNHLFTDTSVETELPETEEDIPQPSDGYDFVYLGFGNASQFYAAHLYSSPSPDYPYEEPLYTDPDGNHYYLRQGHNVNSRYNVEGIYIDGELVAPTTEGRPAVYSSVTQFILIDPETGELITTYCADLETPAENGFSYSFENLESADYYSDEQAAMIRTVALNGYWGNQDDAATEEPEMGSLAAVQQMMLEAVDENGQRLFSDEEIAGLTDGVAMSATQLAIWTFSNAMSDVEFINTHYISKDENNENSRRIKILGDISDEERPSANLLFKLYDYMVNLPGTEIGTADTSNTVITPDNFIEDVSLTVVERVEGHENNRDTIPDNDAFVADLTFTLVVAPSVDEEGNPNDSLVVYVLDKDGNELASGRISGEPEDGETLLEPDDQGNYTLTGIELIEGEQNFHITLQGIQNLDQGVYLYSSEVVDGTSSQTMVGIAEGERSVDVSMNITFQFDHQDQVVVTEHVWRTEYVPGPVPDEEPPAEEPEDPSEEDPPAAPEESQPPEDPDLVEVEEPEVPLAPPPKLGQENNYWMHLMGISALALAAVLLMYRMRFCI